ncbi:hypothetical protein ACFO3J_28185 [Streptomyces polygonati]|uniref:Uncharacterized protein n=1 Tax=Streptomyces polygonati TaxID=1617087 RepID=A0ABV8HWL5_9ACTN
MLLRSNPNFSVGEESRIEIYMGNVEEMFIRSHMEKLRIWRPTAAEAADAVGKFQLGGDVKSLFLISSDDFFGFVVSGRPAWREAVRDLEDSSLFDFDQEWPPGPEVQWGNVD